MTVDPLLAALQADRTASRDWLRVASPPPAEPAPRPCDPAPRLTIRRIIAVVARFHGISVNDLKSDRRTANVVRPRQVAMYLAKQLTLGSLPAIGRLLGDRDHTTVLHAVRRIEARLAAGDAVLREQIATIHAELMPTDARQEEAP